MGRAAHVQGIRALGLLCEWAPLVGVLNLVWEQVAALETARPEVSRGMISPGVEQQESEMMGRTRQIALIS